MIPAQRILLPAVVLVVCIALTACAGSPPAPPPAPARKAVVPTSAVAGKPARAEFPGFRRVVRNDVEYFCQSSTPTGTRARKGDQCYTRDELKRMEETNRDVFKDAASGSSHDSLKMDAPR